MERKKIIYVGRKVPKNPCLVGRPAVAGRQAPRKLVIKQADKKLIQLMRSIGNGVIGKIKVRDGSPVSFKFAWKNKIGGR